MSELNLKYGENQRSIPAPASVADALKAFDRDAAKKSIAAKLNGEEVDLNKQLDGSDQVLSIEPILPDTRWPSCGE
jgi:sulfur carrier protein ThiS